MIYASRGCDIRRLRGSRDHSSATDPVRPAGIHRVFCMQIPPFTSHRLRTRSTKNTSRALNYARSPSFPSNDPPFLFRFPFLCVISTTCPIRSGDFVGELLLWRFASIFIILGESCYSLLLGRFNLE